MPHCGNRENYKLTISPFDQLKFALAAYNDANRQSNRMWSACAIISLFVISFALGSEIDSVFGVKVDSSYALPLTVLILSLVNISYSVCHVSAYRIAAVYQAIVKQHFGQDKWLAGSFTWYDLAQRAPVSNFNRIYPLFLPVERKFGHSVYRSIKILYDLMFCGFPSFVIMIGLANLDHDAPFRLFLIIVGIFSVFSTALLTRWIVKWQSFSSDK